MRDTGYNPLSSGPMPVDSDCTAAFRADHPLLNRIAMTEMDTVYRHTHVHGVVHDENACALGGVAGHAGLFSSARDLAIFCQMLLNDGEYGGVQLIQPATVARWTARQTQKSSRALGLGHTFGALQRRALFLAEVVRPHGIHGHEHLDRPRARIVRGSAHQPRRSYAQQHSARSAAQRYRRCRTGGGSRRAACGVAAALDPGLVRTNRPGASEPPHRVNRKPRALPSCAA